VKLYDELAPWWPILSPPPDYADEVAIFAPLLERGGRDGPGRSLLELGAGGGNNALHLKGRYATTTLVDLSPQMLEVSRALNPDCEHVAGDMRTVRLGRTFDAVFVHDAVEYMTSEQALREAIATAYVHCAPGGIALFVPDFVRETFVPGTEHGGSNAPDGRAARYLLWKYDQDPDDDIYNSEFAVITRDADGKVRSYYDPHEFGLFPRATWLRLLNEAGFVADTAPDTWGRVIFIAARA
jgi:SAM-dependent methyltransferase